MTIISSWFDTEPVLPVLRWVASLLGPLVIVYISKRLKQLLRGTGCTPTRIRCESSDKSFK